MDEFWNQTVSLLPLALLRFNLLQAFLWYITLMFVLGLALRLRFYRAVYDIVMHVRFSCPFLFQLIHEHWLLCIREGIVERVVIYLAVLVPYMVLNRFVWPLASINFAEIHDISSTLLAFELVLLGMMFTLDGILIAQVSRVDAERVKVDLNYAEEWLGGSVNRMLNLLGKWNPLKRYADSVAKQNLFWLNQVLRHSMSAMILQLVLRIVVAASLFAAFYVHSTLSDVQWASRWLAP